MTSVSLLFKTAQACLAIWLLLTFVSLPRLYIARGISSPLQKKAMASRATIEDLCRGEWITKKDSQGSFKVSGITLPPVSFSNDRYPGVAKWNLLDIYELAVTRNTLGSVAECDDAVRRFIKKNRTVGKAHDDLLLGAARTYAQPVTTLQTLGAYDAQMPMTHNNISKRNCAIYLGVQAEEIPRAMYRRGRETKVNRSQIARHACAVLNKSETEVIGELEDWKATTQLQELLSAMSLGNN